MSVGVGTSSGARDAPGMVTDLVALTKPGVTLLLAATLAAGAVVAPGQVDPPVLSIALLATALVMGAANALNMYLEREVDAEMDRTRSRPLPAGRLAPRTALRFGVVLAVVGLAVLILLVNLTTGLVAAVALASYLLAYTPLKRATPWAMYVGAIPGAAPPLMGWTSMTGEISVRSLAVFAILFFWQIPHFCAIAIFRREDYERAGLRVLPVARGIARTRREIVVTATALVVASFLPAVVGLASAWYAAVAAVAGASFLGWAVLGQRSGRTDRWARSLFFASLPYLVVVYAALSASAP